MHSATANCVQRIDHAACTCGSAEWAHHAANLCASMRVERGQIRTVCVFYITILYHSLGLFDPCHYNFHISEICHHYSPIWKLAITIVPIHVPYHFLHLKRDRTHLQIVVFSYRPKYHAERASSCCRRVGAWASHHYRAGEPSPPRGQAVAAARVSQCHWASARVSRHHTGTTTAAAKDWTYRTPSPRRRTWCGSAGSNPAVAERRIMHKGGWSKNFKIWELIVAYLFRFLSWDYAPIFLDLF